MSERYRGTWNGFGELELQRKFAVPLPVEGQDGIACFDETERQVIECRPHLVQGFTNGDSHIVRGERNLHCSFALRLHDDFVRFTSGISGNAVFDFLDVFRCPEEFELGRVDVANRGGNDDTNGALG